MSKGFGELLNDAVTDPAIEDPEERKREQIQKFSEIFNSDFLIGLENELEATRASDYMVKKPKKTGTLKDLLLCFDDSIRDYIIDEADATPGFMTLTPAQALTPGDDGESPLDKLTQSAVGVKSFVDMLRDSFKGEVILQLTPVNFQNLQYKSPAYLYRIENKLMQALSGELGVDIINNTNKRDSLGRFPLIVRNENKIKRKKEITSYVIATYEPEAGTPSSLTLEEQEISNAIFSIYKQAEKAREQAVLRPDWIYRAMPGTSGKPSRQMEEAIIRTVRKFMVMLVTLDATQEAIEFGWIGKGDTFRRREVYLKATEYELIKRNGERGIAWIIDKKPLNLEYAELSRQLVTIPYNYMAITKVKRDLATGELKASTEPLEMSEQRRGLAGYMAGCIGNMKKDHNKASEALRSYERRRAKDKSLEPKQLNDFRHYSDVISFDTIFRKKKIANNTRQMASKNRKFCFDVLDFWTAKGFIKGYEKETQGRTVTGVKILY